MALPLLEKLCAFFWGRSLCVGFFFLLDKSSADNIRAAGPSLKHQGRYFNRVKSSNQRVRCWVPEALHMVLVPNPQIGKCILLTAVYIPLRERHYNWDSVSLSVKPAVTVKFQWANTQKLLEYHVASRCTVMSLFMWESLKVGPQVSIGIGSCGHWHRSILGVLWVSSPISSQALQKENPESLR